MSGRSTRVPTTVADSSAAPAPGVVPPAAPPAVVAPPAETSFETIGRQSFDHSRAVGVPSGTACGNASLACAAAQLSSLSASGPEVRGAQAGLPTSEPVYTMLTQSLSVAA